MAIFDLPTNSVLLYNVPFWGLSWTPLPTLIWDVINERSLTQKFLAYIDIGLLFFSIQEHKKKKIWAINKLDYWSQQIKNMKKIPGIDLVDPAIQEKKKLDKYWLDKVEIWKFTDLLTFNWSIFFKLHKIKEIKMSRDLLVSYRQLYWNICRILFNLTWHDKVH